MKIHVMGRKEIESMSMPRRPHAVISISDPRSDLPWINSNEYTA